MTPEIPFKRQAVEPVECLKTRVGTHKRPILVIRRHDVYRGPDRPSRATGNSTWTNDVWSASDVF